MFKLLPIALLVVASSTGCIVRGVRSYPSHGHGKAPMESQAQRMSYDEAVARSHDYANSRGYSVVRVKEAHMTGNDVWKVKIDVARADARGKIHFEYDAWSRELLRADEKVKHAKDDDHRGKGHGKSHHRASAAND